LLSFYHFFITTNNCRTACKEWGIRDPLRSRSNKNLSHKNSYRRRIIHLYSVKESSDVNSVKESVNVKMPTAIIYASWFTFYMFTETICLQKRQRK